MATLYYMVNPRDSRWPMHTVQLPGIVLVVWALTESDAADIATDWIDGGDENDRNDVRHALTNRIRRYGAIP